MGVASHERLPAVYLTAHGVSRRCLCIAAAAAMYVAGCGSLPRPVVRQLDQVTVRVDRTRVSVAETIRVDLEVVAERTDVVAWPERRMLADLADEGADQPDGESKGSNSIRPGGQSTDLICLSVSSPVYEAGRWKRTETWEAFDTGRLQLTTPALEIQTGPGDRRLTRVPTVSISVRGLAKAPAPLITRLPLRWPWGVWAVVSFALAALAMAGLRRISIALFGSEPLPAERLQQLEDAYARHDVGTNVVIETAVAVIRGALRDRGIENVAAFTTAELLETDLFALADDETFRGASNLFATSEAVQFGGHVATATEALAAIRVVRAVLSGKPLDV